MKSKFLIALVLFSYSCKKEYEAEGVCLKRTGKIIQKEKSLSQPFTEIELHDNIDLELIPDTLSYAVLEAGENVIDGIELRTESGKLVIGNANSCNFFRSYDKRLKVYLHTNTLQLKKIFYDGGGKISSEIPLPVPSLTLESPNSGSDVYLSFKADSLFFFLHTGCTNLYLDGTADYAYFYSSGNSIVHAENMVTDYVHVHNNSTGDFFVNAVISLLVEVRSLSTTWYRGNPALTVTQGGPGEVKPL